MNKLSKAMLVGVFAFVSSCSCSEQSRLNEAAANRAEAAVTMVMAVDSLNPSDEFAMEHAILEVKSVQSEYDLAGKTEESEVFRTTFEESLKQRAPKLASRILAKEQ